MGREISTWLARGWPRLVQEPRRVSSHVSSFLLLSVGASLLQAPLLRASLSFACECFFFLRAIFLRSDLSFAYKHFFCVRAFLLHASLYSACKPFCSRPFFCEEAFLFRAFLCHGSLALPTYQVHVCVQPCFCELPLFSYSV
jgi:hypothetical protein